jgi:hypothetical protein
MTQFYSSDAISLVISGESITGWSEDQMLDTNYNEPERFITKVDATGKAFISKNNNGTGYLKITLRYGSDSNPFLNQLCLTRTVFSWLLRDTASTGTVASSTASIIKTEPAILLGRDEKEVEWEIFCMQYTKVMGSISQDFNFGAPR